MKLQSLTQGPLRQIIPLFRCKLVNFRRTFKKSHGTVIVFPGEIYTGCFLLPLPLYLHIFL